MSAILDRERDVYEGLWGLDLYRRFSPGEAFADLFVDMARTTMRGSVLDAGCGAGKGALALQARGFDVTGCDVTAAGLEGEAADLPFVEACLWRDLKRKVGFKDWVYCCDVLEHIPEAFAMLTVSRLLEVARRGVFLSICLMPDQCGAWAGRPLHQTVHDFVWWRDHLRELAPIRECRDLLTNGVYLLEASRS